MTEYIPRKDLEDLDAAAIQRMLDRVAALGNGYTIRRCTTTGCINYSRSSLCRECLMHELEARKA